MKTARYVRGSSPNYMVRLLCTTPTPRRKLPPSTYASQPSLVPLLMLRKANAFSRIPWENGMRRSWNAGQERLYKAWFRSRDLLTLACSMASPRNVTQYSSSAVLQLANSHENLSSFCQDCPHFVSTSEKERPTGSLSWPQRGNSDCRAGGLSMDRIIVECRAASLLPFRGVPKSCRDR